MAAQKRIGLLLGQEWSFPPAFLEEVNGRDAGVLAEYVELGGTRAGQPLGYDVIVDRISHRVPYYRTVLKHAVLQGAYVINDPFRWSADDKFAQSSLAASLDVPAPRAVALPQKSYARGVVSESLRNLSYPLDWENLAEYVGLPAILKDIFNGHDRTILRVDTVDALIQAYDETGERCMMLQELIETDHFVHSFCVGHENTLVVRYDSVEERYLVDDEFDDENSLQNQIGTFAHRLNRALGYDVNSIEFAVRDGVPYAIDLLNPAPEIDINRMTPRHFDWFVQALADYAIDAAFSQAKIDV